MHTHTHAHLTITGGRTSSEIINWLTKKTGPPAIDLTDADAAKKFSEKEEVVLMGFFKDVESKAAKSYLAVAENQDSLAFGITSTQEVADALEATFDSIVLFKQVSDRWVYVRMWTVCDFFLSATVSLFLSL